MKIAEETFGPYEWGVYDLLLLPPSFPFGGMENPCLTFVTPTLLAGDRSLADVVAHEITHSWFGNLCTNSGWDCFFLNEGFTKFGESRIMRKFHKSKDYEDLMYRNGRVALEEAMRLFGESHEFTRLCPRVHGQDPDDAFSSIPYEKGSLLLQTLESIVGQERFEAYLKAHVAHFKSRRMTQEDFKEFIVGHFKEEPKVAEFRWREWFYGVGMPSDAVRSSSSLAEKVDMLFASLAEGGYEGSAADIEGWYPAQVELLLDKLVNHARELSASAEKKSALAEMRSRLDTWGEAYGWDKVKSSELRFRWLILALVCGDEGRRVDDAIAMAKTVGRMKFCRPLYRELGKANAKKAKAAFEEAKGGYHPITAKMVAQDLSKV